MAPFLQGPSRKGARLTDRHRDTGDAAMGAKAARGTVGFHGGGGIATAWDVTSSHTVHILLRISHLRHSIRTAHPPLSISAVTCRSAMYLRSATGRCFCILVPVTAFNRIGRSNMCLRHISRTVRRRESQERVCTEVLMVWGLDAEGAHSASRATHGDWRTHIDSAG